MILASDLRTGMCIRHEGELYKTVHAEFKIGTAKLPNSMHARLRNLRTGNFTEMRFHPEQKIEQVSVEPVRMEYSYSDEDNLFFMHPETFELIGVPRSLVGNYERFMEAGDHLKVEFFGEEPIDVILPQSVEATVASTGAQMHGAIDAASKAATLSNGVEIQVPQFITNGDRVRIDVATGKYIDRVSKGRPA